MESIIVICCLDMNEKIEKDNAKVKAVVTSFNQSGIFLSLSYIVSNSNSATAISITITNSNTGKHAGTNTHGSNIAAKIKPVITLFFIITYFIIFNM